MSLTIDIAGTNIPTDSNAIKDLKSDLNLAFHLASSLGSLLDSSLSNVPQSANSSSISYNSPSASWSKGPLQFGLQGGASGTLTVVTGGDLITYTDGLDSPQQKSISVPPTTAYMKLTLNFNISANAAAAYSGGAYGVKAALDTSVTYAITYCKAFLPSATVRTAIAQTFESFMFPLHAKTIDGMNNGDYIEHEFDGNMHLSFGAYAGLDHVLYAGQSSVDVVKAFGSPLATLSSSTKPEIKAGVSLDFSFQYATKFEALLSKISPSSAGLHLYRSQNATSSTVLKAGLTFDANTTASITSHAQTFTNGLVGAAGGVNSPGGQALSTVLSAANTEINKYVTEVNDKLTSWLNRANGVQANLQVAIETSKSRTTLAAYNFDLTSAQFGSAWGSAINGDFVAAFQAGAVTLDPGSGMEQDYQRKTSFSCNFFNLWNFGTWNQFTSNVSLVYAGNNVFHFVAKVGRTTETDSMGAMHSMDFYFAASADTSGSAVSNAHVDLHIDLTAQADPAAAARIATILHAIEGGPVCDNLANGMHAFADSSKKGTAQLQVTIPSSAFVQINCDPYSGDKPQTSSTYNDSQNWNTFAQAADDLNAWPLRSMSTVSPQSLLFLKTFNAWEILNMADTGAGSPNRIHTGNIGIWPDKFPQVGDTASRDLIVYSMLAGQSFMNFCAALRDLANAVDVNSAGTTWEGLLKLVTVAIKKDLNIDFLRPAALATIRLCKVPNAPLRHVSGPTSAAVPVDHFAVAITV